MSEYCEERFGSKLELDEDCDEYTHFRIDSDDFYVVETALNIARKTLKKCILTPHEIVLLCLAMEAIDALPEVIPDIDISYGATCRVDNEDGYEELTVSV